MATSFGWRSSFFVLSGAWGLLAIYALLYVVESAPDCEKGSYFKDLHRIMTDPSLLFLLLTEACILGALFVPWFERCCRAVPILSRPSHTLVKGQESYMSQTLQLHNADH